MTDREMLELAAKAAGIQGQWVEIRKSDWIRGQWVEIRKSGEALFPIPAHLQQFILSGTRESWDPLDDDGDEARLEAALGLDVEWGDSSVVVSRFELGACEPYGDDKQAARRRAGVRAAAEIGKSMEGKNA